MAVLQWKDVSFSWDDNTKLFENQSFELEQDVYSLIGQNGTGKSTMMALSAGRLLPQSGRITLLGKDSNELQDENQKNLLASIVYQNMEFESQETLATLFEQVQENGNIKSGAGDLRRELIVALEMENLLNRHLHKLSKGEMQRALIIFALLYGSPLLFLDEPIFAMEEYQKEKALEYLKNHAEINKIALFISVHQLELSKKYSNRTLLFHKDGIIKEGPSSYMHQEGNIEKLFQVPINTLYHKEKLFRDHLDKPEI
ncbi:MAG: ATP-binding cassette domain-containing protein, partial [Spirochaetaceae bacterium]|nr:ATP-binding cassette domain-containing protein [Spirochaetaceae bacterium]